MKMMVVIRAKVFLFLLLLLLLGFFFFCFCFLPFTHSEATFSKWHACVAREKANRAQHVNSATECDLTALPLVLAERKSLLS